MLILQQMNQIAEPAFIASVGSRLDVGLLETPAEATPYFAVLPGKHMRREKALTANAAQTARNRPHGIEAGDAHGEP